MGGGQASVKYSIEFSLRLTAAANNGWYDIVKALADVGATKTESKKSLARTAHFMMLHQINIFMQIIREVSKHGECMNGLLLTTE